MGIYQYSRRKTSLSFYCLAFFCLFYFSTPSNAEVLTYDISSADYPQFSIGSARVYYPSNLDELQTVGATTLTGGMFNTKENMYWLAHPLAEAGIVVIVVSARNNLSVAGYETAHKSGLSILNAENEKSKSPIYGKVKSYGTIGYSMGGGGAINVSSELGEGVKTCVALAPYGPNPRITHTAATLVLCGTNDQTAPPTMGKRAYDDIPTTSSKLFASMEGEGHLYWRSRTSTGSETEFIVAWLKYFLEDHVSSYSIFSGGPGSGMTDYVFNGAMTTVVAPSSRAESIIGTPSVTSAGISLRVNVPKSVAYGVSLFNASGRLLRSQSGVDRNGMNEIWIDRQNLPQGFYLLQVQTDRRKEAVPITLY